MAALNETCMRSRFAAVFAATLPTTKQCFDACPQPLDVRSDCYIKCWDKGSAVAKENVTFGDELVRTWLSAFESGGCPKLASGVDFVDRSKEECL